MWRASGLVPILVVKLREALLPILATGCVDKYVEII